MANSPAYARIAATLRARIGALPAHTLVDSEREFAEEFGVSRMTARRAIDLLEAEGFVYRRPPRGTFVAEPRLSLRVGSFSQEITRLGLHPDAVVLSATTHPAPSVVADALGLSPGDEVLHIQRVRSANGQPVALESTYLSARLAPGLLADDLSGSLWAMLRASYAVEVTRSEARIESLPLDEVTSGLLGVRQASPSLVLTRRAFDRGGVCVEYAVDIYRADRTSFVVSEQID